MDVEAGAVLHDERQGPRESPTWAGDSCVRVQAIASADTSFMRSSGLVTRPRRGCPGNRDRAGIDPRHHGIGDPGRIGPVADIIAEEHVAVDAMALSVFQAGRQGLPVAMDVGHQRDAHEGNSRSKGEVATVL